MSDPSFGTWLRRERERRGATLKTISDQIKVSVPLLQGLEADDLSRWPAGIFRRAFVRSYASAIGLDPDDVIKRFEREYPNADSQSAAVEDPAAAALIVTDRAGQKPSAAQSLFRSTRARVLGTVADLTVALVLGLGSAAAGSRLLWPVLLIAAYYALGILLTGTSPMVALLSDAAPASAPNPPPSANPASRQQDRRPAHRRSGSRSQRSPRAVRPGVQ